MRAVNARPLILSLLALGAALTASALPAPDAPPGPTFVESWERAHAIIYGKAVRIQADATDGYVKYDSTLRIERSLKGELRGDVHIVGGHDSGCYISAPFRIEDTYLVVVHREPDGTLSPREIHRLRLAADGTPEPPEPIFGSNPFSLFGESTSASTRRFDNERALELLEFSQRMAGHEAEALRLREMREVLEGPRREQERLRREEAAASVAAKNAFAQALRLESLAERKATLIELQGRLGGRNDEATRELREKIHAELSVVDTLLANGVKSGRPAARQTITVELKP